MLRKNRAAQKGNACELGNKNINLRKILYLMLCFLKKERAFYYFKCQYHLNVGR